MNIAQNEKSQGSALYFNWKLKEKGEKPVRIVEYPLYTDAYKIESAYSHVNCPYTLVNPDVLTTKPICLPRIILQVEEFNYLGKNIKKAKNFYSDFYLINNIPDQVAVILSLILGVRIRAGNESRLFQAVNLDQGIPLHRYIDLDPAQVELIKNKPLLPTILKNIDNENGFFSLNIVDQYISSFSSLTVTQAELVIRAAKLYRDAIWIVDSEPQLSLILLISVIELLSQQDKIDDSEHVCNGICQICKKHICKRPSSRKQFENFLINYLPDPPTKRCREENQINWNELKKKKNNNIFLQMYRFRSKFLHEGIAFPLDFLNPNSFWVGESDEEFRYEKSIKTSISNQLIELSPMSLSIFEYIVRNAALKWWRSIINVSAKTTTPTNLI